MPSLKITDVAHLGEVPFKPRHVRNLTRENWDWTVYEIQGEHQFGGRYGETMVYYTWSRCPRAD